MMSTSSYASVSSSKSNEDFDQDNETQRQIKLEEESKNMAEALVSVQDLVSDQVQDFHSLKRQINNITTLVKDNKPIAVLQSRSEYVRHLWMTCQQRNSQIHRLVTPEERKSLQYIKGNEFGTIELLLFEALDSIAERIAAESPLQLGSTSTPQHDSYHSEFTHSASNVKLPRINLITFSGQFTEWQTFHDTFVSLVKNNNSLDNISKLHYLRSTLRGEALDTICHIQLTAANFEVAWDLLIKQYDNKIALVNAHLNAIFSMESIKKESASKLALLRNSVKKHIGALQNLGRLTDGYDDILINRVVTLLDLNTKRDWELWLASQTEYPKYSDLDAFLVGRIRALESLSGLASENATFSHETSKGNQKSKFNIGKSHHASAFGNKCPVCNHNHYINQCKRFKESSVHERFNLVKQYKLCTNCLKANHRVSDCPSKFDCFKCNGKHHTLLHRDTSSDVVKRDDSNIVQYPSTSTNGMQIAEQKIGQSHFLSSNSINPSRILLATARVWVLSPANRAVRVRALLDQGSTWTFMSRDLAHALGVKRTPISASWAGVGGSEAGTATSMANIRLSPNMIGKPAFETQAIILPKITSYIPDFQVPKRRWAHLDNLNLADDSNNEDPIHLLIGADLYGAIILDGLRKGKINEPVAQNTVFGWVISGNIENKNSNATQSIVTHHCITNKDRDASLRNFWEIEEISSKPVPSIEDELCELHFRQTHSRDADGRYIARKWLSNSTELLEDIDPSDHGLAWSTPMDDNHGVKILGLHWNPKTDSFGFKVSHQSLDCVTKRSVLSLLAKLYDPMGWISPVIVSGKIFMQQLWRDQYSWDDPLPENLALSIVQYFNSMPKLSQIKIPRWTGLSPSVSDVQIHGFSDASEQAYGAVVYLRITKPSGENIVSLLASKTKVAPLKQLSIPRLELEAAVLLSRLVVSIRNARSLSQIPYQCWTDSSVVLAWLSQHASKWKTFVANRVSEIHSLVPECQWRYVPTDTNPADLASRGKSVDELVTSSLWWNGPSWLPESTEKWPSGLNTDTSFFNLEEKLQVHIANTRNDWFEQLSNLFTRCSKWSKILRVVATVFKFVHILRSKVKGQNLKLINQISAEDLNQAEEHVIKHLQQSMFKAEIKALEDEQPLPPKSKLLALNPFLENGILRVGGRLARSELPFDAKHPIVLSSHRITTLIIENVHHRCLHGGVKLTLSTLRQAFWVLNPRPQVKSVINRCLQCAKIRAKMATQIMADLPSRRVTRPDKLFTDCGVDYAGPLQFRLVLGRGLVYQPRPCYIAIFVCFAVKAIHLELVTDYSTETFIAAFKRFTSRRGFPARMYSDCGTNFRGADRVLQSAVQAAYDSTEFRDLLAEDRIVWNFNPPAAPHFGGLWEAGVRSVKGHLKRILGDKKPTLEEFMTLLCQIEAALNSRPLGPLNDTIDDFEPLTPGHFLTGGSLIAVPQPTLINLNSNRLSRWEQIQQCFELFWRRWSTDYLTSLQQRSKWRNETIPLKKGQLVLLKQPNLPPTKWLLGRVEECRPGADGRIRVVQVRTAKSSFLRPITELALLPIDLDSHQDHTPPPASIN